MSNLHERIIQIMSDGKQRQLGDIAAELNPDPSQLATQSGRQELAQQITGIVRKLVEDGHLAGEASEQGGPTNFHETVRGKNRRESL